MSKQHPKHDRIAELIAAGMSDRAIWVEVAGSRHTIAKIRRQLGVGVFQRLVPVAEQLATKVGAADADGHQLWTGALTSGGAPRLRLNGGEVPVSHVLFEQRAGRRPSGHVRPDCGVKGCVAPTHLMDDTERRKVRLMTRTLLGHYGPWDTCRMCGGDWDSFGRVDDQLRLYCTRCSTNRKRRNRGKGSTDAD